MKQFAICETINELYSSPSIDSVKQASAEQEEIRRLKSKISQHLLKKLSSQVIKFKSGAQKSPNRKSGALMLSNGHLSENGLGSS